MDDKICKQCGLCCSCFPYLLPSGITQAAGLEQTIRRKADIEFAKANFEQVTAPAQKLNTELSNELHTKLTWFRCKLQNPRTKLCTIYDKRPLMCIEYPLPEMRREYIINETCEYYKLRKPDDAILRVL